jgi:GNAT superfamily N-acetyltransferase
MIGLVCTAGRRQVHRHPWPERFREDIVVTGIGRNEVLVAVREGSVVGTVALENADPLIWGERDDALFVHRLAVRTANRGQGIGDALLEAAAKRVRDAGRTYLCLDCAQHNADLRRYYTTAGFTRGLGRTERQNRMFSDAIGEELHSGASRGTSRGTRAADRRSRSARHSVAECALAGAHRSVVLEG